MAWEKRPIDKMEMFDLLGKIYCKTAFGFAQLGLRYLIQRECGDTLQSKVNFIIKALVRSGLILVEGKVGKGKRYKWNLKQFGPVSIPLAEMIIAETAEQARIRQRTYYHAHKNDLRNK